MRIRNARTFSFLGMGGRGNSPPQWDANFLLFYYLKNIFSIDFFMGYSLGGRVGDAFSNTPQMCGRGLLRSRFGGWAETQRWDGRVSKVSDSKQRKPDGDKQSCWGFIPEQTPLFWTRGAVVGGRLNLSRTPITAPRVRV